jgi:hypothetical protein
MHQSPLTLDEVKSHFDHWRATRTKKRERIPMSLWEEVRMLISRYSLSEITKILSINTGQIKDNIKLETKIGFVEVKTEPLSSQPERSSTSYLVDHNQTCSIELSRANGVVLKISLLPIDSLQRIILQFME